MSSRNNGVFVDCAMPNVQHEGVLIIRNGEIPFIEIHDRNDQFGWVSHNHNFDVRRIVGRLAREHYILATDIHVESVSHPSFGAYNTVKCVVHGDLIHSTDRLVWEDEDALVDTLHAKIDRLEDWALPSIGVQAPGRYSGFRSWSSQGMSVLRVSPEYVKVVRPPDPELTIDIGDGFSLRFESRLRYGDGERTFHSFSALHDAVMIIESEEPRPMVDMKPLVSRFRMFLRFLYDEKCQIRSIRGTRRGRNQDVETVAGFDEPIPHVHMMNCPYRFERLPGHCSPLFRLDDVDGQSVVQRWFSMDSYLQQVLDGAAGGSSMIYSALIAAGYLGQIANQFRTGTNWTDFHRVTKNNLEQIGVAESVEVARTVARSMLHEYPQCEENARSKWTLFMDHLGLDVWGVDTEKWGKEIGEFRDRPAHGAEYRGDPKDIDVAHRVILQLLKLYALRELGVDATARRRIFADRHWAFRPA